MGARFTGGPHDAALANTATVSSLERIQPRSPARPTPPPSNGTSGSLVAWMIIVVTGRDGVHSLPPTPGVTLGKPPATEATPRIRSACKHAIVSDMKPPFEWPAKYTRSLSTTPF